MATPILLSQSPSSANDAVSLEQIAYLGRVLIKASSVSEPSEFIRKHFARLDVYVDATDIAVTGDIVDILNAGAAKVFVSLRQLEALSAEQDVPASRLVVYASSDEDVDVVRKWIVDQDGRKDVGVCLTGDVSQVAEKFGFNPETQQIYRVFAEDATEDAVRETVKLRTVAVIPSDRVTFEPQSDSRIPVARLVTAPAVADQSSGLYATLVTDERGVALGFVWSSQESISEALRTGTGVYQSRKRGLWYKGQTSGDTQVLRRVGFDCDADCIVFVAEQQGRGFCHLGTNTCFGPYAGLSRLQKTLQSRKESAPPGSYTARLFNEPKLIEAKIMEEAEELCQAKTKEEIAAEAADLLYFALTRCVAAGVSLEDIERNLDLKNLKVKRRAGDAKGPWAEKVGLTQKKPAVEEAPEPKPQSDRIQMRRLYTANTSEEELEEALRRPSQKSNEAVVGLVKPIIEDVRKNGDAAVLKYTHKFEKATSLTSPVIRAPFPPELMQLPPETIKAIDLSFENIKKFHAAQQDQELLQVETMPGVTCSRFSRPIERVGLYIPGGTAVLPSTALMLGVPAMVAGCKKIVFASPPRADGTVSPEIVYAAHKVGAESIVLAGGAQAVAALAYGTESIIKVDKILGPGNQFVTAAKMLVSNDTSAGVSIDMPAGPSEVLVIADRHAHPAFVASDLLSQAEHGVDSQVVLIAIDPPEDYLRAVEDELERQARALPRVDIVRGSLQHSVTLVVRDTAEALALSNRYAPEHLILQLQDADEAVEHVQNAGSVFVGEWTPESVGDYSAGVNHSLRKFSLHFINLLAFANNVSLQQHTATQSSTPASTLGPSSNTSPPPGSRPTVCEICPVR